MSSGSHAGEVLLHQGIGLDAFNGMPFRRAVHCVFECCYSVPLAADLARARPFDCHDRLFRFADTLLFGLAVFAVASIVPALNTHPMHIIAARGVAGVGAAFIMPATLSLITASYPADQRTKAVGIWAGI